MPGPHPERPAPSRTVDARLLLDPIGFLQTEIYRQRVACNTLEALASPGETGDVGTDAERVRRYIDEDLPTHLRDMEECLFPILRERSRPEDDLEGRLARYRGLHGLRDKPAVSLLRVLEDLSRGDPPPSDLAAIVRAVVEPWRRDLQSENEDILPLAEQRLTGSDLVALGQAMALKRGIHHPL